MNAAEFRAQFPVCREYIYVNNAGVAPTSLAVRNAAAAWIDDLVARGVLSEGGWESLSQRTREATARLVGAKPHEIALVRSTSHGLGMVAEGLPWREGDEVVVCDAVEYPSNVYPWLHLADRGVRLVSVPARDGGIEVADVEAVLTARTRLLAVSAVQYATGHRTELRRLGALCRQRGLWYCVDGIQQVGAFALDVEECGIDFLSADSHKWMLGMPGIGFLYVSDRVVEALRPVVVGWKSTTDPFNFDRAHFELRRDASKLEEGSMPFPMIAGFEAALGLIEGAGIDQIAKRITTLLAHAETRLTAAGLAVGPRSDRRAGILMVQPPAPRERIEEALEASRIVATIRRGRVRISPHFYNTESELDVVVDTLVKL